MRMPGQNAESGGKAADGWILSESLACTVTDSEIVAHRVIV